MAGINKVILVGNLGAKPEIKYASNGNAISNLSVATSESWTDKSTGQKQERTEWHRVSLFGKVLMVLSPHTFIRSCMKSTLMSLIFLTLQL